VPKAIAEGFNRRRLGIVDFYNLRNIQADTEMRRSIASASAAGKAAGG
jgi:uncharacterized protein YqfA (UPF0365 family)